MALVTELANPGLSLLGYLITMFNARKSIHKMYEETLRTQYGDDVFATRIPHAAEFPEAIAFRKPVAQYKPKGAAAKAIQALADEIQVRLDAAVVTGGGCLMSKLDELRRGAGGNVAESMGAGVARRSLADGVSVPIGGGATRTS